MDLTSVAQALLRRWWLLLLLGAVGAAVAWSVTVNAPQQYQSTVTLQLNPAARSSLLPYNSDSSDFTGPGMLAASYAEVLRSRTFGELVVRQLNLRVPPSAIAGAISTSLVTNTNIMRLSVTWSDPADAQQLAQAIAEIFIAENARRQQAQAGAPARLAEMEESAQRYPARIDALRQQRDRLDQAVTRGDNSRLTELNNVETRLAAMETSYANLMVEINRARSAYDTATILDGAMPGSPTGSVTLARSIPFGLVGGVALAVGLILLLEFLDNTIRGPNDIVANSGNAPLVAIGRTHTLGRRKGGSRSQLVSVEEFHAPLAETFRTLRANLRFAVSGAPCRTLAVTSPNPNDGKTFVACNTAVTFAQSGDRVLLVDADLRRSSVHKLFDVPNKQGYLDALAATRENLESIAIGREPGIRTHAEPSGATPPGMAETELPGIIPSGIKNLWLLPAGSLPSDPTAIFGSGGNERFIRELAGRWDIVIFDTAPVLPVADTRLLAASVDGLLVIARTGVTGRHALQSCLKVLGQTGCPVVGVVLNDYQPGRLSSYGEYGDYYYQSQGYGDSTSDVVPNGQPSNGRG